MAKLMAVIVLFMISLVVPPLLLVSIPVTVFYVRHICRRRRTIVDTARAKIIGERRARAIRTFTR